MLMECKAFVDEMAAVFRVDGLAAWRVNVLDDAKSLELSNKRSHVKCGLSIRRVVPSKFASKLWVA